MSDDYLRRRLAEEEASHYRTCVALRRMEDRLTVAVLCRLALLCITASLYFGGRP